MNNPSSIKVFISDSAQKPGVCISLGKPISHLSFIFLSIMNPLQFPSLASSLNSFSLEVSIWSLFLRPPHSSLAGLIKGSLTGTMTWLFEPDWVTVSRADAREGTSVTCQLVQTKVGTGLRFPHFNLHPGSDILGSWLSLELGGLAGIPLRLSLSCCPREQSVLPLLGAFLSSRS